MRSNNRMNLIIEGLNSTKEDKIKESASQDKLFFPTEDEGIEFCKENNIDKKYITYSSEVGLFYIDINLLPKDRQEEFKPKKKSNSVRYELKYYKKRFSKKQRDLFDQAGAVTYTGAGSCYVDFDRVAEYKKANGIK